MFGKYNGFVSKARVSACMYFLVINGVAVDRVSSARVLGLITICDQDASITIIYVELNVLGNRFFLKLFPKKTVNN